MGCGEGKLIRMLLREGQFTRIAGMDISYQELTRAKDRLHWDEMAPRQKERIELFQGALTYRDPRLSGYDAAALVEVIEHLDENRLAAFERVVFEFAQPKTVILTTLMRSTTFSLRTYLLGPCVTQITDLSGPASSSRPGHNVSLKPTVPSCIYAHRPRRGKRRRTFTNGGIHP